MFSYEEMKDVSQNYRVKLDLQTNQFNLINTKTKEILEPSDETNRIKALLIANQTVQNYVSNWMLKKDKEGYTIEEVERKCLEELQNSLIKAGIKGEHSCSDKIFDIKPIADTFFYDCIPRNGNKQYPLVKGENFEKEAYKKDSAIQLINILLAEKGKKIEDIKDTKFDNRTVAQIYQLDSRELTMQEKLNPNNPAYRKSQPKVQLTPEQQAKGREFVEQLIQTYLMVETDKMYEDRVQGENANMKFAVKNSQNINLTSINIPKIMRLLLAAKNVSLYGQKDYLEEIISNPSIYQALLTIKDSSEYDHMVQKGKAKQTSGELVNGKPFGHRETIGERDARIANNLLQQNPNAITVAKQKLSLGRTLKFKDDRNILFYSAVARTLGKTPSYTKGNDGTFEFDSGEEITK